MATPQLVDQLDPYCCAIYLEVPASAVVLLQAYFELLEGAGIVRTLSIQKSLVCIIATPDTVADCWKALDAVKGNVPWRVIEKPREAEEQLYMGYFGKR